MADVVVRLLSPLPPAEIRQRIASRVQTKPLLGHWGFARTQPRFWGIGDWMRLRGDQGVRARLVADDQVVLEQWIQVMERLTVDSCRVELVPSGPVAGPDRTADGTVLVCHFFVPAAKKAVKAVTGLFMLALGLALAVGILGDPKAVAGAKVLFLAVSGAMAAVGILGLSGIQPRARRSQRYVLAWLEQVAAASSTEPGTRG
jgi:hypothetical protein